MDYRDESLTIYTDIDTIYLSYVSDDVQYGGDLSLWPPNFVDMAQSYMAREAAPRIAGLQFESDTLERRHDRALLKAKGTDSMEQPARRAPSGSWTRARQHSTRHDRGNRNRLIG